MKLVTYVVRTNPNAIEEIHIEDVAQFRVDDSNIYLTYNDGREELIPLRANDGENVFEWSGFSIFGTRVGLKLAPDLGGPKE